MKKGQRPSKHVRRIKVGKGRKYTKTKIINKNIKPKKYLAANINKQFPEINQTQANKIVDMTFDDIETLVKKEKEVQIPGFGKFVVKHRKARMGRNPFTGQPVQIKAKKVLRFRPAKQFKEEVL